MADSGAPISRDAFAELLQQGIAAAGGPQNFVYDPNEFTLRCPNGVARLSNSYGMYCRAAAGRRGVIISNFVRAICGFEQAAEITWEQAKPNLITVIRPRSILEEQSCVEGTENKPLPKDPLINIPLSRWFIKTVVIDYPSHMAIVNRSQIALWKKTDEEVFAAGMENLQQHCEGKFARTTDGFFVGLWDDDYDSSRALVPELLYALPLRGRPVVCLPNRSTLLVADEKDHPSVAAMLVKADEIVRTKAQPQNPVPLVVNPDGQIEDFNVAPTSVLFAAIQRAQKVTTIVAYDQQTNRLIEQFSLSGKDIFVASCSAFKSKSQPELFTMAVWTKGVPTMLPVVDWVVFADLDPVGGVPIAAKARWEDVVRVLDDLMLDTRLDPRRFYVSLFPSEQQLLAMKAESAEIPLPPGTIGR